MTAAIAGVSIITSSSELGEGRGQPVSEPERQCDEPRETEGEHHEDDDSAPGDALGGTRRALRDRRSRGSAVMAGDLLHEVGKGVGGKVQRASAPDESGDIVVELGERGCGIRHDRSPAPPHVDESFVTQLLIGAQNGVQIDAERGATSRAPGRRSPGTRRLAARSTRIDEAICAKIASSDWGSMRMSTPLFYNK